MGERGGERPGLKLRGRADKAEERRDAMLTMAC